MYVPRKDYIIEIYRELVQWAHTEMNTAPATAVVARGVNVHCTSATRPTSNILCKF